MAYGAAQANITTVDVNAIVSAEYHNTTEDNSGVLNFSAEGTQIDEILGGSSIGSGISLDSMSDIDGSEILFKNGSGSYGDIAIGTAKTVVEIGFQNDTELAFTPVLNSQILPAGLGMYLTGCLNDNIRVCASRDLPDRVFEGVNSPRGGPDIIMQSEFKFSVVSEGEELYSLSGDLRMIAGTEGSDFEIIRNIDEASQVLNNFRQTSELDSGTQFTYDWDATDFQITFPRELLPSETTSVQYITEVSSRAFTSCTRQQDGSVCPIAYAAFGDPIGRGGFSNPRPLSTIQGFDTGLYRMATSFEDGVLTYKAIDGPGLTRSVSNPSSIVLLLSGLTLLVWRRKS